MKDANGIRTGWRYVVAADDSVETYNAAGKLVSIADRIGRTQTLAYDGAGRLISITDDVGRQLGFGYDANNRITTVTDPAGGVILYGYDAGSNLVSVTYPDGKTRTYHYENAAFHNALTGITDENGNRFATYAYDASGKAVSTGHAGGAELYTLNYNTDGSTTVTDPLGTQRTYNFTTILGVAKGTGQSQPGGSGCGPASNAITYDANGNVASRTDFNGNRTTYAYDLTRNLETSRTEAAGTAQARTITTTWDSTFRLPVSISEPGRVTTYAYDSHGNLIQKSIRDTVTGTTRTWNWSYTYSATIPGVMVQKVEDGPRTDASDLTTTDYYAADASCVGGHNGCRGQISQITNALGQVTRITRYNAHGQPEEIIDPNGLVTTLAYDARQRLVSRNLGGETTAYQYEGVGQPVRITLPDGSYLNQTYDAAHRLIAVADALGNRITYTLDAMGNRLKEDVTDPAGALAQTRRREFDALNRLFHDIGAAGQTTTYAYDAQGNLTQVTDPLGHATLNNYDALNRLVQVTDAAGGTTRIGYDALDRTASITDPNGNTTAYTRNALDDLGATQSPDSGLTRQSFDAAGNLLTRTDAKGQTTQYEYDSLNRLTRVQYTDGKTDQYAYDQGSNALGRLVSITDASGVTRYQYDAHGRVSVETRTILGRDYATRYNYDTAGRLTGITYPDGRDISYSRDAIGHIAGIATTKDGQSQVLIRDAAYHPLGHVKTFVYGDGETHTRGFDSDGRISSFTLGTETRLLTYDDASRITAIADRNFAYDALNRLTQAAGPGLDQHFAYDPVGNRTQSIEQGSQRDYSLVTGSNRLASVSGANPQIITHDANGSIVSDGQRQFGYDTRGRLVSAQVGGAQTSYGINALGQRIFKTGPDGTVVFHYDRSGRLIGESDGQGNPLRDYIYLDDLPVAMLQSRPPTPPKIIDNPQAEFTGIWPAATAPAGFEGADYRTHAPHPGGQP